MLLTDVIYGYIWHRFANRSASRNRAIPSLAVLPRPAFFSFLFFLLAWTTDLYFVSHSPLAIQYRVAAGTKYKRGIFHLSKDRGGARGAENNAEEGEALRGFADWESGGELERVVYVNVWRLGIESRMARPFRVPGVASSWEPSSSGKVSQDLSSFFHRPLCILHISFCILHRLTWDVRATIVDPISHSKNTNIMREDIALNYNIFNN